VWGLPSVLCTGRLGSQATGNFVGVPKFDRILQNPAKFLLTSPVGTVSSKNLHLMVRSAFPQVKAGISKAKRFVVVFCCFICVLNETVYAMIRLLAGYGCAV